MNGCEEEDDDVCERLSDSLSRLQARQDAWGSINLRYGRLGNGASGGSTLSGRPRYQPGRGRRSASLAPPAQAGAEGGGTKRSSSCSSYPASSRWSSEHQLRHRHYSHASQQQQQQPQQQQQQINAGSQSVDDFHPLPGQQYQHPPTSSSYRSLLRSTTPLSGHRSAQHPTQPYLGWRHSASMDHLDKSSSCPPSALGHAPSSSSAVLSPVSASNLLLPSDRLALSLANPDPFRPYKRKPPESPLTSPLPLPPPPRPCFDGFEPRIHDSIRSVTNAIMDYCGRDGDMTFNNPPAKYATQSHLVDNSSQERFAKSPQGSSSRLTWIESSFVSRREAQV